MPYEYIKFSSRNAPVNGEESRFTINLPRTIENAVSAHVKSFSMPNTAYNITRKNNTIEWYETIGDNTNPPALLQATLPTKFYTIEDLIDTIASATTEASQNAKTVSFATPTVTYEGISDRQTTGSITFTTSQIPSTTTVDTYHITLTGTADDNTTANKKFCPVAHKASVWCMLGFPEVFQISPHVHGRVNPLLDTTHLVNPITSRADARFTNLGGTTAGSNATKTARFAPRDSHESYHITSSLATSVYEGEADGVVKHTNYLLTVPNQSNRYSWIQYVPTEPVFHDLKGVSLNQFTIGLADENGFTMSNDEHQAFSVVLAIEYKDLHQTFESNQLRTLEWRRSHC